MLFLSDCYCFCCCCLVAAVVGTALLSDVVAVFDAFVAIVAYLYLLALN